MTMYEIYVDGLKMPLGTPKFVTKIKNRDKEVELINGKVLSVPKPPGLTEFEFEVLLPKPDEYLKKFSDLKLAGKPFQLIVIRGALEKTETGKLVPVEGSNKPTNVTVTLMDYTRTESSEYGTMSKVSLKFKEYVGFKTGSVEVEVPPYTPLPTPPDKPPEDPAIVAFKKELKRLESLNPPSEYKVISKIEYVGLVGIAYRQGVLESWKTISKKLLGTEKYGEALSIVNVTKRNDEPFYSLWAEWRFPGTLYPKPKAVIKIDLKAILETYNKLQAEKKTT